MSETATVVLELAVGEDWAAQIFWADEYGDAVPTTEPIRAEVKDANGQVALAFTTDVTDLASMCAIRSNGAGFFQLTAPRAVTTALLPGRYAFDLWACVDDPDGPWEGADQRQQVVTGWVQVLPRVTSLDPTG
jgi:hypothetical protein